MNKNNIIKKVLVYFFAILILYSGIYYFFDSIPNSMTVNITMKQTTKNWVGVFYNEDINDGRHLISNREINASNDFQTVKLKIPLNYVYSLDLLLDGFGETVNEVDIKKITVSTLFSKKTLHQFDNMSYVIDNDDHFIKLNLIDNYVFSAFQLTTKIKIISFVFALIICFIFRRFLNRFSFYTKVANDRFKIVLFIGALCIVFVANFLTLDKSFSLLRGSNLASKPVIKNYTYLFNSNFMNDTDSYLKDQFLYNANLIEDYYDFNRAIQRNQFDDNYFTKINGMPTVIEERVFDQYNIDISLSKLNQLNQLLTEHQIPHYMFLIPNKEMFYEDFFPGYMKDTSNYKSNYIINNLSQTDIQLYDLTQLISENSLANGQLTHFNLDHHWTTETAFDTYKYILEILNNELPARNLEDTFENTHFYDVFSGTYGRQVAYGYKHNQQKDDFTLFYPSTNDNYSIDSIWNDSVHLNGTFLNILNTASIYSIEDYSYFYDSTYSEYVSNVVITNNSIDDDSMIVVLGDSYSEFVVPYLATNYKTVVQIDQRKLDAGRTEEFLMENIDNIDMVINLNFMPEVQASLLYNYFK